jgi:hypothetical protein
MDRERSIHLGLRVDQDLRDGDYRRRIVPHLVCLPPGKGFGIGMLA